MTATALIGVLAVAVTGAVLGLLAASFTGRPGVPAALLGAYSFLVAFGLLLLAGWLVLDNHDDWATVLTAIGLITVYGWIEKGVRKLIRRFRGLDDRAQPVGVARPYSEHLHAADVGRASGERPQ
jgi:hypothetical protein